MRTFTNASVQDTWRFRELYVDLTLVGLQNQRISEAPQGKRLTREAEMGGIVAF